jgi:oxygen-independent coproporphyrinogen III oxidase
MAGIYIHIPFCKRACHYCNFHFSTSLGLKNGFLEALLKEIQLRKHYLGGEKISTIYFGGGTPSLLETVEIQKILSALHQTFEIEQNAEITLEANPDDISAPRLESWKTAGVNRLSIGVQSFFEEDLRWMNRAHTAEQSLVSIPLALDHFPNITIDLIYGMPTLTDEKWKANVERAISLKIPHLSCYALTVEPKTALEKMISQSKMADVDSNDQARQFLLLMDWLSGAGYEHYEISNFALPGKRSRHNSSYWRGAKYLGLGPSAHSFDGESRQWNIANNALYIKALDKNELDYQKEILTPTQQMNEYIMTSLRTAEGLDVDYIKTKSGDAASETIRRISEPLLQKHLLYIDSGRLILTKEGKLFADGIAADLFFEEDK